MVLPYISCAANDMTDVFLLTFGQLGVFLLIFCIGIVFTRAHVLPERTSAVLSRLITYVFLPAMCLNSFISQFTLEKIGEYASLLLAGTALMLVSLPLAAFVYRRMQGSIVEKLTAAYSMVVPNYAYFGYPLVLALFGQEMLSKLIMFGLPFNFFIYGWAMPRWMPQKPGKRERIRRCFSPPMLAMLLGMAWGLSGLRFPELIGDACAGLSDCMAPCAMLVSGCVIGRISLKRAFLERRTYLITAIRLALIPVAVIGLAFLLGLDGDLMLVMGVYVSVPLGMNPVVFSESYGRDGSFGASCALVSMLLSTLTLPLVISLLQMII